MKKVDIFSNQLLLQGRVDFLMKVDSYIILLNKNYIFTTSTKNQGRRQLRQGVGQGGAKKKLRSGIISY